MVQDFLCVKDIEQAEGASLNDINTNQRFGALGKLHNLVVTALVQLTLDCHGQLASSRAVSIVPGSLPRGGQLCT